MTDEQRNAIGKARKMQNLMANPDFKELIMDEFMGSDLVSIVYGEDVGNQKTQDQLKARKILRDFMNSIIFTGQVAAEQAEKERGE